MMLKLARGLASVVAFCCVSVHSAACDRVSIASNNSLPTFAQARPSIISAFCGADDLSKLKAEIELEQKINASRSDCGAIDLTKDLPGLESLELSKELGHFRRSTSTKSVQALIETGTLTKPNGELLVCVQSHCDFSLTDLTGEEFKSAWEGLDFDYTPRCRRSYCPPVNLFRPIGISRITVEQPDLGSFDVGAALGVTQSLKSTQRSGLMDSNLDEKLLRLSNLYVEHTPQMFVAMSLLYEGFVSKRTQPVGSQKDLGYHLDRREASNSEGSAQVVMAISRNVLSELDRDVLSREKRALERNQRLLAERTADNLRYSYRGSRLAMR